MTSARAYIEESRIYGISNCRHNIPPTCTILDSHQRYFIWIYYVSNIPRVHTDIFIWTQFYGGIGPCSLFIWHMPHGDDSYPEKHEPISHMIIINATTDDIYYNARDLFCINFRVFSLLWYNRHIYHQLYKRLLLQWCHQKICLQIPTII